ncbi:MAG: hypothetical protein CL941_08550 [Desulfobacter sp.]|nr:hypothetical protein [Desulfobacter sp.]
MIGTPNRTRINPTANSMDNAILVGIVSLKTKTPSPTVKRVSVCLIPQFIQTSIERRRLLVRLTMAVYRHDVIGIQSMLNS